MNSDIAFDRIMATAEVGAMNAFWVILRAASVNAMLQFVFLVLSIFYLLWKWRRDAKRKGKGPDEWGDI